MAEAAQTGRRRAGKCRRFPDTELGKFSIGTEFPFPYGPDMDALGTPDFRYRVTAVHADGTRCVVMDGLHPEVAQALVTTMAEWGSDATLLIEPDVDAAVDG